MSRNKSRIVLVVILAAVLIQITAPYIIRAADKNQDLYLDALKEDATETYRTTAVKKQEYITQSQIKAKVIYPESKYIVNTYTYDNIRFGSFLVENGAKVKKGDKIAELTVSIDNNTLKDLKLSIQREEESLTEYRKDYELLSKKYTNIQNSSNSSKERQLAKLLYDRLQLKYNQDKQSKEANISQLKQQFKDYQKLKNNGSKLYIRAACTGVIADLNHLNKNDKVDSWQYIAVISDTRKLLISVEGGSAALRYNMPVTVTQNDISVKGRVITCSNKSLSSNLLSEDTCIEVYGKAAKKLENRDVTVKFQAADMKNALVVESSAVSSDDSGSYINLLVNGIRQKQYIICGASNGSMTWILSGAQEGDIVLMN